MSRPQKTSHGIYWYNLHVAFVHRERWMEVREEVLQRVHDMIVRVCEGRDTACPVRVSWPIMCTWCRVAPSRSGGTKWSWET